MNFILDASVTVCWMFLDGKPADRAHALRVLEVMKKAETRALVPVTWSLEVSKALSDTLQIARRYRLSAYDASYLELAMRAGLPLATLDEDLQKAASKAGVTRFAAA